MFVYLSKNLSYWINNNRSFQKPYCFSTKRRYEHYCKKKSEEQINQPDHPLLRITNFFRKLRAQKEIKAETEIDFRLVIYCLPGGVTTLLFIWFHNALFLFNLSSEDMGSNPVTMLVNCRWISLVLLIPPCVDPD